ncbi:MAG: murein biosynthesis integral membrane protein MurJ [Gammaproteobacteria bacterium]|nr:murein biosynthesis integral membrane protein MurJ [Gammaproteobacteria bacterium]NNL11182.1 murein biosynthesis integral membrane protein MurJ [Pseudomonadales bacterium]RZV54915.1 MAG: murein biosynthesis integral membrane protein MurJ [Pseudomonadales bacterium]
MPEPPAAAMPKKQAGLLGSSMVVGSMTMFSRVLGLLRDVVIARLFGASGNADAFFIAFRIPQFLRRLFAEGAFSQAFVPVLAEYRSNSEKNGQLQAVRDLLNAVCGVLGGTLLLLSVLVVLAAPLVAMLFAPGFINQPEKFELTVTMLRITFPYLLLISLTGFAGAILNSYDRFAVPAFTPVLLNVALISAALWLSPRLAEPVFALAWGVLIAGFAQLLFQIPFLARLELLPRPRWQPAHEGVRRIMRLMLPAIFGVSVSQINLLLDTVLASFLPTGSVSWLYYSDRLAELPLGVFGIAIATVILPGLSRMKIQSAGDGELHASWAQFSATLEWALRCIALIALPAMVALMVLAEPILYLLFQYQAMQPFDVQMSALSLRAYALGLLAFMAIKVLATGYYSRQDMKTPVRIGIIAMVANMVLNLVLVTWLHVYWQVGHVGLALATALSAMLNALLLYRGLGDAARQSGVSAQLLGRQFGVLLLRIVLASLAMGALIYFLLPGPELWQAAGVWWRLQTVAWLCVAGALALLLLLALLGVRPAHFQEHAVTRSRQQQAVR